MADDRPPLESFTQQRPPLENFARPPLESFVARPPLESFAKPAEQPQGNIFQRAGHAVADWWNKQPSWA